MITHYTIGESCSHAWLMDCLSMESEGQLSPQLVQTNLTRVVSRDAIRGEAPMEVEVQP